MPTALRGHVRAAKTCPRKAVGMAPGVCSPSHAARRWDTMSPSPHPGAPPMNPSRRMFLQSAAVTTAAFAVPAVQARGANEKLNVGLIGCGNRGRTILTEVLKNGHNAVALCDIA